MIQAKSRLQIRIVVFFCIGLLASLWLSVIQFPAMAQGEEPGNQCAAISQPLTPEEMNYAQSSWNYFVDNVQPNTGLSNSAGGYPSGTLWDLGNYLTAMNAVRWMGLIDQNEFDSRLNQFLTSLSQLRLFEDTLPNKVYNSATGEMVDYGNNPIERGIGWSALDIGRILAAFHIIRTCHPQYSNWLQGILDSWQIAASLQDGMLYGATVLPDNSTLKVQEGRLGYEEYAARGYALWGWDAPQALAYEPFKFVDIYGLQIPVDTRNYQDTNANNYVVSESYILDAIEFGLNGELADYARRVFEVQKRRYEDTGLLTAVSEDNINKAPYFLYSTVFSNGVPWAVITEANELHPELRTLSAKSAFGWRYVYPDDPYAQQIFDHVKDTCNSGRGYYAGIYESGLYDPQPPLNDILTGNTNGLLLEILYYKARGYQPMLGGSAPASPPASTPDPPAVAPETSSPPQTEPAPSTNTSEPVGAAAEPPSISDAATTLPSASEPANATSQENPVAIAVTPINPVGLPQPIACPIPPMPLSITDRRYAKTAWQYFEANYEASGLVPDRSDLDGITLWGMGDYISALHAARTLDVVDVETFDQRVRHFLGALRELPLFAAELPHRSYSTLTLEPIDYGGSPTPEGNGWSGLDVGRLLAALHTLKTCHPQYAEAVDTAVLDWSYLRVVRNGRIANAHLDADQRGRARIRVNPTTLLGYEEYAARAFQLWGFDASHSAVGGEYLTANIEGREVPVQRSQPEQRRRNETLNTTSTPFILYGLEFGFDPQMRSLVRAIFEAEAHRYESTGAFSASGTTLIDQAPYVVHNTLVSDGRPWRAVTDDGTDVSEKRMVSTAIAFAYHTLFPEDRYGRELWLATLDLYNPLLGYYEGFYEANGRTAIGFTASTNSLILQALLHKTTQQQPLIQAHDDLSSPWWQTIRDGDPFGQGLPEDPTPQIEMATDDLGGYWIASSGEAAPRNQDHLLIASPRLNLDAETAAHSQAPPNPMADSPNHASQPVEAVIPALQFPLKDVAQIPNANDQAAARLAWRYFENNWEPRTGLVNAVDGLAWTTLWDQGSAILGLHAAHQLGLLSASEFDRKITLLLSTLEQLPLPSTGLLNKAYSTADGQMRTLANRPDPEGRSGWSVLDIARFLTGLYVIKTHYPSYQDSIEAILARYDLSKLVKDGWLQGSGDVNGRLQYWQEGRLGYEQYAAHGLRLWKVEAINALTNPPIRTVTVEGISLEVDSRNRANSNASNYLTSDPYLLWGLELGWPENQRTQVSNLLKAQANRFERTGILTAVNEDALDRSPYFLYYSVYADGRSWTALSIRGRSYPHLRFLSTKAAFAWNALFPDESYAHRLRAFVQTLADPDRGYLSGRYEDPALGPNRAININTNAIVLESLLFQTQEHQPLLFTP